MKKIVTLAFVLCYCAFGYAQSNGSINYEEVLNDFLEQPDRAFSSLTKVPDSILFQRINQTGSIRLEKTNTFRYNSLAEEIQQFDFNYDINTDTLLFIDEFNTIYNPGQIVESAGRTEQGQYSDRGRTTENFRNDGALENTLEEVWDTGTSAFVNSRFTSNYFIPGTDLVDSIIAQIWDPVGQQWQLNRWDFQYFGNDDLRDSVYTYLWDTGSNNWKLANKIISEYDGLGQQTKFNLFEWNTGTGSFELLLEVFEYYNGAENKDSTHVFSYFGGYYGENLTVFTYNNDLVVSDTIYAWDVATNGLRLVNYQNYQYDMEDDVEELRTYAYDPVEANFVQITQVNYFYSKQGEPNGIAEAEAGVFTCLFSNPHKPGEIINCELVFNKPNIHARVYGLDGRLYFKQLLYDASFQLPSNLRSGLYILSLEQESEPIRHYKLIIQP